MRLDALIFIFWILSFKPAFSLSSFTFIKKLFNSSLSALRVVSSAYLRLLIFLAAILIPACASSSLAFCMMYSACKLNKHGDNIQPWCIPFPVCNQSVVPCPVLTVASWPAYRFLRRQVRCSGIPISLRIFHSGASDGKASAYNAGDIQSLGWEDLLEKKWQPTPVFLIGKSHGWRILVSYSPWGHRESDMTEWFHSLTQSKALVYSVKQK